MDKINILFSSERELTDKELCLLIPENIQDSIVCVRDHDGESAIFKGEVEVYVHRAEECIF